ncbi:MAG: hypothetical protein H6606_01955 [Flavobacteriales bacterium]|nr:hypothetical protein [Flavobacteriales bacterium]
MEKKEKFDFEAFEKSDTLRLKQGERLLGKEGVLTTLLRDFLEKARWFPKYRFRLP